MNSKLGRVRCEPNPGTRAENTEAMAPPATRGKASAVLIRRRCVIATLVVSLSAVHGRGVELVRFVNAVIADHPRAWVQAGFFVSACTPAAPPGCLGEVCIGAHFRLFLTGSGNGTASCTIADRVNLPVVDAGSVTVLGRPEPMRSCTAPELTSESHPNGVTALMKMVLLPHSINSTIARLRTQGVLPSPSIGPTRDARSGVTYALWQTPSEQMESFEVVHMPLTHVYSMYMPRATQHNWAHVHANCVHANCTWPCTCRVQVADTPAVRGGVLMAAARAGMYYVMVSPDLKRTADALHAHGVRCSKPTRYFGRQLMSCDTRAAGMTTSVDFISPARWERPGARARGSWAKRAAMAANG